MRQILRRDSESLRAFRPQRTQPPFFVGRDDSSNTLLFLSKYHINLLRRNQLVSVVLDSRWYSRLKVLRWAGGGQLERDGMLGRYSLKMRQKDTYVRSVRRSLCEI